MIRSTTNGVLKGYRYNLQRSMYTLNKARDTVLTQRTFNSFAEDPATAVRTFQMRRSFQRTNSQYDVNESVVRKYNQAWSSMARVKEDVNTRIDDSAYTDVLRGINDPTASGRNALGQSMKALAKSIVQTMNCRYGDNFVFAGADGLNVPFTWDEETGALRYRDIPVDAAVPEVAMSDGKPIPVNANREYDDSLAEEDINYLVTENAARISKADYTAAVNAGTAPFVLKDAAGNPVVFTEDGKIDNTNPPTGTHYLVIDDDAATVTKADYDKAVRDQESLDYLSGQEVKYADIGLGLQEENGEIISSSAFDVALQGINFLGYGVDEDGDPKNIVSIISRMGDILLNCDPTTGAFAEDREDERAEFQRLAGKFEDAAAYVTDQYIALDTEAGFLKSNQTQLKNNAYNIEEQFLGIEDVDLADAISAFSWAQYCYNAALKVGNSILSQSLMDYINT